jgi:Second Messenger Oligonucleotide or Dinucleotide Synthetase domain
MGVGDWFFSFCDKVKLGQGQRSLFATRTARITRVLNIDSRNSDSDSSNRFYVGSMGRNTAIPSVSDVDLLYMLPYATFVQYEAYGGNKQSALLSAVRNTIRKTYPNSEVSGDGQVVVINFADGVTYEVLPAFLNTDGGYNYPDSNGGGAWRTCWPRQEMDAFADRDATCNRNLVELCRMVRAWRDYNAVPMSGMLIDTFAYQFIETWPYRDKSYLYYDYLTRDFFNFLAGQDSTQHHWRAPGSMAWVRRTGPFEYKARQAELRALEALAYLSRNEDWSARQRFREIYGTAFPS